MKSSDRSLALSLMVLALCLSLATGASATDVSGTISSNTTWTLSGSPYTAVGNITVADGVKLTIQAGVTVRFAQTAGLWVEGELDAQGSSGNLITFTGTTETKGWWRYIHVQYAGSATLNWCRVLYAGWYDSAGVLKDGTGSLSILNSVIDSISGDGIRLGAGYAAFTSAGNTFSNNHNGVRLGISTSFDDDTSEFQGNTVDVFVDGGTIWQDVTWNLKSDYSVYVSGNFTVSAGRTLTVKPGTAVKFAQNYGLWIEGQLDARGSSGAPVYFTDWRDDSVGGDANHDGGATQPGPGWWRYIYVRYDGSATLDECRISYAGWYDGAGLLKQGAGALSMSSSTITDTSGHGLKVDTSSGTVTLQDSRFTRSAWSGLYMNSGAVTAAGCTFSDNGNFGILQESNDSLVYENNTFSGNASGSVGVRGGTISKDITWTKGGGGSFSIVAQGNVTLAEGKKLTVKPGTVVKFEQNYGLWVEGELDAQGSSGNLITFTGTNETKGWWRYIHVTNAGSAILNWCRVSYAGWYDSAGVLKVGTGSLSIQNSVIDSINGDGLRIGAGYASFTSAGNTFSNNHNGVRLGINTSFDDNTSEFQGNTVDVFVDGGTIGEDVAWNLKKDYSVYVSGNLTVSAGKTLTLKPGTVVKFAPNYGLWIEGELDARGSSGAPVYFTDWRDDSVGGDANHDGGATQPGPGWWRYIYVGTAGAATLDECRISYAGWYDGAGLLKQGTGSLSMNRTIISHIAGDGLRIDGSSGAHEIYKCRFSDSNNGVLVRNQAGAISLGGSSMEANADFGVVNQGTIDVDARSCWWGHATGPHHPTLNPDGQGDTVSDRVLFEPWRENAADNEILSPVRSGKIVKGDSLRFLGAGPSGGNVQNLWQFGDSRTSSLTNPGVLAFSQTGQLHVTFGQVLDGQPDPYPDTRDYEVVDDSGTFPDLAVTVASVPASLEVGKTATITYSVKNVGTSALQSTSWTDALYLSKDAYLDTADTVLADVPAAHNLGIGAAYQGAISFTFPAVEEGAYYLILSIDDEWEVLELRQLNNEHALAANGLVPVLTPGVPLSVAFSAGSLADYYRVDVPTGKNLLISFDSSVSGFDVVASFGTLPSRGVYDYRMDMQKGELLIPAATPGTWYILVFAQALAAGGQYSIEAALTDLSLLSVSPQTHGTGLPIDIYLEGAGFTAPLQVALLKAGGGVYNAAAVEVDSYSTAVASFSAGAVPAGVYDVQVMRSDGASDVLSAAIDVVAGGKPKFEAKLILPNVFGYHQLATVYIEYANTGDAPMAAPLLLVRPTQKGTPGAILTLDQTRLSSGFWTSVMPQGFSNEVQFLASGETPGLLLPGESRRVPIYYAGWQQPWDASYPPFDWGLGVLDAEDATAADWDAMKDEMRPYYIQPDAWEEVWNNFMALAGSTWGDYVAMLSRNAQSLYRQGLRVDDIEPLLAFSMRQSDGLSPLTVLAGGTDAAVQAPGLPIVFERSFLQPISRRFELGALGRGWTYNWRQRLTASSDGTVIISDMAGTPRIFQPDSRYSGRYLAQPGDEGRLTADGGGFRLNEASGEVQSYSDGKLIYVEDASGNRITCEYAGEKLTRLHHSAGGFVQFEYNAAGFIASVSDHHGRQTRYNYTGEYLTSVETYDGRIFTYTYNSSGPGRHAMTAIGLPDGTRRGFGYDERGRLVGAWRDDRKEMVSFTLPDNGWVIVTDALGNSSRLFFDHWLRVLKTKNVLGETNQMHFDDLGNLVAITATDGIKASFAYDSKGNLVEITDTQGQVRRYTYTRAFNRLASFTDVLQNRTKYDYDDRGHLTAIVYPDGNSEHWAYDPQGNATSWTNRRGNAVGFSYDAAGRFTGKSYADGSGATFSYDSRGNLLSAEDDEGRTTFTYDENDYLLRVTYPHSRWLAFGYDAAGRRIFTEDQLGYRVNYHYDTAGRLSHLSEGAVNLVAYAYDELGRLSAMTMGNGVYTTYDYDAAGRLSTLINHKPNDKVLSSFAYTYDRRGQRVAMQTHYGKWDYQYDNAGQLTRATLESTDANIPDQDLLYEYDSLGNRVRVIANGQEESYDTNELNQYTQVGDRTYTFDADGNLIREEGPGGSKVYLYNDENRLIGVMQGGNTWDYTYDALGNRVAVDESGAITHYILDPFGLGNVVAEYDSKGDLLNRYTHGIGLAHRWSAASGVEYFSFDPMGNTSDLTGTAGALRNAYAYRPFGQTTMQTQATPNPFLFMGQLGIKVQSDGLHHVRARSYNSMTGRYNQMDPIGIAGGDANLYRYVFNSPTGSFDPTGLSRACGFFQAAVKGGVGIFKMVGGAVYALKTGGLGLKVGGAYTILSGASDLKTSMHAGMLLIKSKMAEWGMAYSGNNDNEVKKEIALDNANASKLLRQGLFTSMFGSNSATEVLDGAENPVSAYRDLISLKDPAGAVTYGALVGSEAICYFAIDPVVKPKACPPDSNVQQSFAFAEYASLYKQDMDDGTSYIGDRPLNCIPGKFLEGATNQVVSSWDPNEKIGVAGVGEDNFIRADRQLSYRIDFENFTLATAPAQIVTIRDPLSEHFDWSTLELGEVGFGDVAIQVPEGLKYFETVVDYDYKDDDYDFAIEVHVEARIEKGTLFFSFISIDPETGLPPPVDVGFLMPETEPKTGRGQGYVTFLIKPKPGLSTGTEIRNVADIQFDFSTIIATNQVDPHDPSKGTDPKKEALVTIDASVPVSQVTALAGTTFSRNFVVSWNSTDTGSGIQYTDVYVRDNGGDWTLWREKDTGTSATFSSQPGHTYSFYSVATDWVGNREEAPLAADATTAVSATAAGEEVVSGLWIRGVFKPSWTEHFELRWKKGGEDVSATGDRTVWGYLYADPADFPYGSASNPEVFVKIYVAANGWKNIAFNHVSVDEVDVFSALDYTGQPDRSGTISITERVIAHPYEPAGSPTSLAAFIAAVGGKVDGWVGTSFADDGVDGGYNATEDLWIRGLFKPTWMAAFNLRWHKGGEAVSATGDRTVWGYLYADPADFPYGSESNPEVFVKIYKAVNGWQNIAFNHVSVDDVDVFSALNYAGSADQTGTISIDNRVVAHPYDPAPAPEESEDQEWEASADPLPVPGDPQEEAEPAGKEDAEGTDTQGGGDGAAKSKELPGDPAQGENGERDSLPIPAVSPWGLLFLACLLALAALMAVRRKDSSRL